MSDTKQYTPGDIANGHILTATGQWVPTGGPTSAVEPKGKKPIYKRWWAIALAVIFVIGGISQAAGNGGSTDTGTTHADKVVKAQEAAAPPAKSDKKSKPEAPKAAKPAAPSYTMAQTQAIASAKNYLSFSAFSKAGLIEQLSSQAGDGYALKDARFAVNHITVNWNNQAVAAAKNYLSISSYSHQGLVEQLESKAGDQYTHAQAEYGVTKAGL